MGQKRALKPELFEKDSKHEELGTNSPSSTLPRSVQREQYSSNSRTQKAFCIDYAFR